MGKTAAVKVTSPEVEETLFEKVTRETEVKRLELSELLKTEVHTFCFPISKDDRAIAYLKEPPFSVQKMAMDMSLRGSITDAAQLILDACIIQEHSDPRIWSEDAEERYPRLRLGAIMRAKDLVAYYDDAFKKK